MHKFTSSYLEEFLTPFRHDTKNKKYLSHLLHYETLPELKYLKDCFYLIRKK